MKKAQRAGRPKGVSYALTAVFLAVIYGFGIAFILLPDRVYSETENKYLASMPNLSDYEYLNLSKKQKSDFAYDISTYYSEQFPLRTAFVGLCAKLELASLRFESNGVMQGSGGYLISRADWADEEQIAKNLAYIGSFTQAAGEAGIPSVFAIAPRGADVLSRYYPAYYSADGLSGVWETADASGVAYADLRAALKSRADAGEYVYYKTDHHWTSLGAYYAYREIITQLGGTPYSRSDFSEQAVTDEFYGTSYSTAAIWDTAPDSITYFRYPGDADYTVSIAGGKTYSGFYDESYLEVKDKYSSFLSGNNACVTVTDNGDTEKETLLVIKDSFAHSIIPFLARHYNIVMIDLRYYNGSPAELAVSSGADKILILYGMDSLTSSDTLRMLSFRMEFAENE